MSHKAPPPPPLFAQAQADPRTLARATDPATSHRAAAEFVRSGKCKAQAAECLRVVRDHPGHSSKELPRFTREPVKLDRYQCARRLPELERIGLVHRKGERDGSALWWPGEKEQ